MSSIAAVQPLSTGEAWQAVMQAALEAQEPTSPAEGPHDVPGSALPVGAGPLPAAAPADMPAAHAPEPSSALLPMAPVLLQPLTLRDGPALRERAADATAWQRLLDAAGDEGQGHADDDDAVPPEAALEHAAAPPPWVQALVARLQRAATAPASMAALRPALQAWRVGQPVLLASPAGLASLQWGRGDAGWRWRRWPARWRSARPAVDERWWAVRVGWGAPGRPRTLRDLVGGSAWPPGQVSCELRLDGGPAGLSQWTEVLVQAAAAPSLQALLAARPSLPWVLCNQPLWLQEPA
jgi:hypothetical protein